VVSTKLSIDYSNSSNEKVLRIYDTSEYCSTETIQNYLVEVLPANKSTWVTFFVQKGFSLALNSSNLRYHKVSDTNDLIELPDGIYEIKQSFKPNLFTVKHVYHLRNTHLLNKLKEQRDILFSNKCNLSREEYIENRDKLREIEEFADAAKYKVEEKLEKKEGIELYKWAEKLLEQYTNECQC
jgi:hypothetical protein